MIHHCALRVPDATAAARGLATLLAADLLLAPSPAFPPGSWLVALRDQVGSLIAVLQADAALQSDPQVGLATLERPPTCTQTRLLLSTPLSQSCINATVANLGWRSTRLNSGLYAFTQIGVQNHVLVDLMTQAQANIYRRRLGLGERPMLEARLRRMKKTLNAFAGEPAL